MKVVLTMIDTAGIQDYIFGSNRLRENIGASYLVEQATRAWVCDTLNRFEGHNIKDSKQNEDEANRIDRDRLIEQDGQTSELIFAGGGNAAILFRSPDDAKDFAWKLSRQVLEEAPGLEIVIAHSEPFEWNPHGEGLSPEEDLRKQIDKLRDGRLAEKKRTRQATPTPLLGLGVTAECEATGLVATQNSLDLEAEPRLVSREIMAKLEVTQKDKLDGKIRNKAKDRLLRCLRKADPNFNADQFEFSDNLNHLGRIGGEESYIAVVHIDGNSMGEVIKNYVAQAKNNREYIKRMRDFSDSVERASDAALAKTMRVLRQHIKSKPDPKTGREIQVMMEDSPKSVPEGRRTNSQQKQIPLYREEKDAKPCWPFRPLVFGGDDVTFVCDGQLGLSLATIYMNAFTSETRKQIRDFQGQEIHTGAGVCIVKVHYPFRRAYDLSVALTKEAKKHLKDERLNASAIDWHISSTGLSGSLKAIRAQEYEVGHREKDNKDKQKARTLLMRPVRMRHDSEWRTWEDFNRFVAAFNYDNRWAEHRNKIKSLREALRAGDEAVKEFLAINKFTDANEQQNKQNKKNDSLLPEPINAQWRHLCEVGWENDHCVYFDAIEAMDHHLLLEDAANGNTD